MLLAELFITEGIACSHLVKSGFSLELLFFRGRAILPNHDCLVRFVTVGGGNSTFPFGT